MVGLAKRGLKLLIRSSSWPASRLLSSPVLSSLLRPSFTSLSGLPSALSPSSDSRRPFIAFLGIRSWMKLNSARTFRAGSTSQGDVWEERWEKGAGDNENAAKKVGSKGAPVFGFPGVDWIKKRSWQEKEKARRESRELDIARSPGDSRGEIKLETDNSRRARDSTGEIKSEGDQITRKVRRLQDRLVRDQLKQLKSEERQERHRREKDRESGEDDKRVAAVYDRLFGPREGPGPSTSEAGASPFGSHKRTGKDYETHRDLKRGRQTVQGRGSYSASRGDGYGRRFQDHQYKRRPLDRREGELKWQRMVRKKKLGLKMHPRHTRGSKRNKAIMFPDEEGLGDEPKGGYWRHRKLDWLCRLMPAQKPRGVVTLLNNQRHWIRAEDTRFIIHHLIHRRDALRAHRVLKWEVQQDWHVFDYDLFTKVAVILGEFNKFTRMKNIYNLIIQNGKVPDLATYEGLINCCIADGDRDSLTLAWSLYNQISRLGNHEPTSTLRCNLFKGLMQKGLPFLEQADEVFDHMKKAGLVVSAEMYSSLIQSHGMNGNQARVATLLEEMRDTGLPVGQDAYCAILKVCAKDGNVEAGEKAFADLRNTDYTPPPLVYAHLIKMYGKASLPERAYKTYEDMKRTWVPSVAVYEAVIEVAVLAGHRDRAEGILKEAQGKHTTALQNACNLVMELYCKEMLVEELEAAFKEMSAAGSCPNQASFNILLHAYVKIGAIEKAEEVYETMKLGKGKPAPDKRTFELMIQLYGQLKNNEKIKEMFKEISKRKLEVPETVENYLKGAITPKQLSDSKKSKVRLDRVQREILAGVCLGGAVVRSPDKDRTYEFHFELDPESEVKAPLLNHLYETFSDWSKVAPHLRSLPHPKDPTLSKDFLAFQTVSHGSFRFFAHQYRPEHTPTIPRLVHRWLTPRALAYWYMYGGFRSRDNRDILLDASAYSDKEIMLVIDALKSRSITSVKKNSEDGLLISVIGKSALWLWGLMDPYVLPAVKDLLRPGVAKLDA